jgi:REP element-mobilizing transposase RayT
MRMWLLTWTTYGSWLPGDSRGFVSRRRVRGGGSEIHNTPDTPYDSCLPVLVDHARSRLKGEPIRLNTPQAMTVRQQLEETSIYRGWTIRAGAVMANHVHLVVEVPATTATTDLLRDFKAYASRSLTDRFDRPVSGTWWTASGSCRHLPSDESLYRAIAYVQQQEYPLTVWTNHSS